jgi:hypothetical protein
MMLKKTARILLSGWLGLMLPLPCPADVGALQGQRHRVLVSTDIGGTDPDDDQSMVHLLLYADVLELEGLVSSPYGPGRKQDILEVIDVYERDYQNLKTYSKDYPEPASLRKISKQGALESPGPDGIGPRTEGSDWIIQCARKDDPRPLHVLVWGGIEDLAQALHDAPEILPRLRVYFIGGPNKTWSVDAYHYIARHHPALWIIEANATYRGWFVGGNQTGEWGNQAFVSRHITGHGASGDYFASQLKGKIKMGDTPSVAWLLHGSPDDPAKPGWGGQFVRLQAGRLSSFTRLTTPADTAEAFSTVEFTLPRPQGFTDQHHAKLVFDNRIPARGTAVGDGLRFRFSPRDAKVWPYVIESDFAPLHGQSGAFTATPATPGLASSSPPPYPNWWIDDPSSATAEGVHPGAKSVSRWREDFLRDFASRMDRCLKPAAP